MTNKTRLSNQLIELSKWLQEHNKAIALHKETIHNLIDTQEKDLDRIWQLQNEVITLRNELTDIKQAIKNII